MNLFQPNTKKHIEPYLEDTIISNGVGETIKRITSNLCDYLRATNIQAKIEATVKSSYSISLKIRKKNLSIDRLHDILAVRIIVDNIEECYNVLGIIKQHYSIVVRKFNDYIVTPKINGYQCLYLVIVGQANQKIELQIRRRFMY